MGVTLALVFASLLSLMVVVSATGGGYVYNPKPTTLPKFDKLNLLHKHLIAIQGLTYCKSGPKLIPIKGAIAKITCMSLDKKSAPFSVMSCPTDAKGYFFATLSGIKEDAWEVKNCKVFLEKSPLEKCKFATDINKGKTGALLTSYNLLNNIKLYSLPPFVYTNSDPKPISKGY